MNDLAVKIIVGLLIFALYLELSPGLGNIWYRINSNGDRQLVWKNLLIFTINPFWKPTLWCWQLLDINSIIFVSAVVGIWYLFQDVFIPKPMPHVKSQSLDK
jgi:hypothetical protein